MATGWSNEETFKFIELYQNHPVIWNPKHKFHKDKNKVNDAWARIADEMCVPVSELKRKKETLLAAFRLNHKKVVASLKSGAGEDEVYKPIWIFYDALAAFLTDVYECKSILVTADKVDIDEEGADVIPDMPDMQQSSQGQESSSVSIPVQKRRSTKVPELAETNAQIKSTLSTLNDVLTVKKNRGVKVEEDDCDLYGRLLAKALREFSDIDRLELRHEIDGLIIKKKRSLTRHRHYASSPSQIIISTNRPSTSQKLYSEQLMDSNPSSVQSNSSNSSFIPENAIYRPCSSASMFSTPPHESPQRMQNQGNMSRHVYSVVSSLPDNENMSTQNAQSQDILYKAFLDANVNKQFD